MSLYASGSDSIATPGQTYSLLNEVETATATPASRDVEGVYTLRIVADAACDVDMYEDIGAGGQVAQALFTLASGVPQVVTFHVGTGWDVVVDDSSSNGPTFEWDIWRVDEDTVE